MKKLPVVALVLFVIFVSASSALAATLTVRADSWAPFCSDPKDEKPGYMVEVLKAIFEPQGVQVDYQIMPWARSIDETLKGKYDAIIGADREEAAGFILPRETFGKFSNTFFVVSTNRWRFKGVDSLKQVKLGVIEGYSYGDEIDAYIKSAPKGKVTIGTGETPLPNLLKMLQTGRIDVILEDATVVAYALISKGVPSGQIISASALGEAKELFVAFAPGKGTSEKYSEQFSVGIVELRKSGKLKKILDRYNVRDWK